MTSIAAAALLAASTLHCQAVRCTVFKARTGSEISLVDWMQLNVDIMAIKRAVPQ